MPDEQLESLFDEATDELQEKIAENLSDAEAELPDADGVWGVEADNVLGVLNQLQTALEVADAEDPFKEARKWYVLGEKADAFGDETQTAFEERLEAIQAVLETAGEAQEQLNDLTPAFPELRSNLQALEEADEPPLGDTFEGDYPAVENEEADGSEEDTEGEDGSETDDGDEGEVPEGDETADADASADDRDDSDDEEVGGADADDSAEETDTEDGEAESTDESEDVEEGEVAESGSVDSDAATADADSESDGAESWGKSD